MRPIRRREPLPDNDALRALTWIFARCPIDVQHAMVDALAALQERRAHPLLAPLGGPRVVLHSLGRVVTDPDLPEQLIPQLAADLHRPNLLAALSSLLSRPAATPSLLSDTDVDRIATTAVQLFRQLRENNCFGTSDRHLHPQGISGGSLRGGSAYRGETFIGRRQTGNACAGALVEDEDDSANPWCARQQLHSH